MLPTIHQNAVGRSIPELSVAKRLAFVLGGGGARGALQVGALRALLESGRMPDLLVGTSVGACNAAYLALNGISSATLDRLAGMWRDAMHAGILPPNYLWLSLRTILQRRQGTRSEGRLRDFFLAHGMTSHLRFADIRGVRLLLVASDLNSGRPVIYGTSPAESVLEGVMASSALPPWIRPRRRDDQLLADGGFLSNLPIETAFAQGATEIVALDLADVTPAADSSSPAFQPGLLKVAAAVMRRQTDMEIRLAEAYGVQIQRISLFVTPPLPIWDFSRTEELLVAGYEMTRAALTDRRPPIRKPWWAAWGRLPGPDGHAPRVRAFDGKQKITPLPVAIPPDRDQP